MKKNKLYILIGIVLFVAFAIYYDWHSNRLLADEGVYTIATIEKVQAGGRGCSRLVDASFVYNSAKHFEEKICIGSESVSQSLVGKRVFIKIIPKHLKFGIYLQFNCLVPDSIAAAPSGGWSQEWIKGHFPECVR